MVDKTRKHDHVEIEKGLKSGDPIIRRQANEARDKINKADSWLVSARERLVKDVRDGKNANAWDVRDEIIKHEGRKGATSHTSFSFSFPEGFFHD